MPHHTFIETSKEYEKNKELKKEDVQLLQEWITEQPHLPEVSEINLILFLHRCYYNIESTKECIERFYTVKAQWPEIFKNRRTSVNRKIIETLLCTPLPKLSPEGYQIIYLKLIDTNADLYSLEEQFKSLDMTITLNLHQTGTVPGHIVLIDVGGVSFDIVAKINPIWLKKLWFYVQEVLPIRLVNFIFVNSPPAMEHVYAMSKSSFNKEFVDKLQIYTENFDEVYKLIPKEHFPSDYGGEAASIEELTKKRNESLLEYESFFVEGEEEIADESKRIGESWYSEDMFDEKDTSVQSSHGEKKLDTFIDVAVEYEKNEELRREDVQLLQEWVVKQPHLPKVSELYLILFLHSCYYNIEATKKKIDTFYTVRASMPEFFKNRRASINTKIVETILLTPLPRPTPEGYQIFYVKFIDFNPDNYVVEEHIKGFDMAYMLLLHQKGTRSGHIILVDLTGFTSEHIAKISSATAKNFFYYFQEALPIRLIKYIFINMPPCMDEFWALIVPHCKQELLEKIQLYSGDLEGLYQTIPKECFPSDYGGGSDSIEELTKQRKENLLAYETFFVEGEKETADESKRVHQPRSAEDIFREEDTVLINTYGM